MEYPGARAALGGLSFSVGPGETFGLLGPNGSGKTTTVRILVTLLRQTSGRATVGGYDVARAPERVRGVIGYAGQFVGVDDDLTGLENLALQGILHGILHRGAWVRAGEVLEAMSLTDVATVRAGRLSGGQRRRLDVAQALVHRPAVVFLDEPTTGLDPQSRTGLWEELRRLSREEGTTVFLTTQYLEEADRVCDRVVILDAGRLVKAGVPADLKAEVGGGRLILGFDNQAARARAASLLHDLPGVVGVARRAIRSWSLSATPGGTLRRCSPRWSGLGSSRPAWSRLRSAWMTYSSPTPDASPEPRRLSTARPVGSSRSPMVAEGAEGRYAAVVDPRRSPRGA